MCVLSGRFSRSVGFPPAVRSSHACRGHLLFVFSVFVVKFFASRRFLACCVQLACLPWTVTEPVVSGV